MGRRRCCCDDGACDAWINYRIYWDPHWACSAGWSDSEPPGSTPSWVWPFNLDPQTMPKPFDYDAMEDWFDLGLWPGATLNPGSYRWPINRSEGSEYCETSSQFDSEGEVVDPWTCVPNNLLAFVGFDESLQATIDSAGGVGHGAAWPTGWQSIHPETPVRGILGDDCRFIAPPTFAHDQNACLGEKIVACLPLYSPTGTVIEPGSFDTELTCWNESYTATLYIHLALPGQAQVTEKIKPRDAITIQGMIPNVGLILGGGEAAVIQTLECLGLIVAVNTDPDYEIENDREVRGGGTSASPFCV